MLNLKFHKNNLKGIHARKNQRSRVSIFFSKMLGYTQIKTVTNIEAGKNIYHRLFVRLIFVVVTYPSISGVLTLLLVVGIVCIHVWRKSNISFRGCKTIDDDFTVDVFSSNTRTNVECHSVLLSFYSKPTKQTHILSVISLVFIPIFRQKENIAEKKTFNMFLARCSMWACWLIKIIIGWRASKDVVLT